MHEPRPIGVRIAIEDVVEDGEDWTGALLWAISELQAHGIPPTFVGLHVGFPSPKDFYSQMRAYPPSRATAKRLLREMLPAGGFVAHTAQTALEAVGEETGFVEDLQGNGEGFGNE
jgi:hypothetical protein